MPLANLPVGAYKVCPANFSGNVKTGQGALLGFYASIAGTASLYDDPATGTGTPIGTALVLGTGWNPLPVAFTNGLNLVLTSAAGTLVLV
jgi:hypothetical protein